MKNLWFVAFVVVFCASIDLYVQLKQMENLVLQESARISALMGDLEQRNKIFGVVFNIEDPSIDMTTYSTDVTITAYSASTRETDDTPELTADLTPSRVGLLAVSCDLINEFGLKFGERVLIPEYGVFEIRDIMNKRFKKRVDILHANRKAALKFGKREGKLIWFN